MDDKKVKIVSIAWTSVFHVFIILLLLATYLKPTIHTENGENLGGIPVMFGNIADAGGNNEPLGQADKLVEDADLLLSNVETIDAEPEPLPVGENNILTQDSEETIAIQATTKKKVEEERRKQEAIASEERHKREEADKIAKEQAATGKKVEAQVAGLFGNGEGNGSRGDGKGTGTQGVETGNASFGEKSGIGGVGGGFKLGNRKLGPEGLIRPTYNVNAEGRVIIAIRVNSKGKVVEATIAQGTNTSDASLLKEALKAAEKTRFNEIYTNKDELGTITYTFTLN